MTKQCLSIIRKLTWFLTAALYAVTFLSTSDGETRLCQQRTLFKVGAYDSDFLLLIFLSPHIAF